MLREQDECWRTWFAEEGIEPIDVPYPVLWRNLTSIVATVLEAIGQDPRLAPAPALERQADERSDEWVDRYRDDARATGAAGVAERSPRPPARRRTPAGTG